MWEGVHKGRKVAVKVLRVYTTDDSKVILSVGTTPHLATYHSGLNGGFVEVLPRGGYLEAPQASKYPSTAWCDLEWMSICNDLGVDGKWEYQ